MQKNYTFKKYHLGVEFIIQQLLINFVIFQRNNNVLLGNKISHLKIATVRKIKILNISLEFF